MPRVLFLQGTDPAAYPPLINAGVLMAEAGWEVTYLSAPMAGLPLRLPRHPRIAVRAIATRPSHVMRKTDYLAYAMRAARLALGLRPDVVYASDILGAGPGLLAARLARAALVYHEHDPPGPRLPALIRLRRVAANSARLVIFPNLERAQNAQQTLGFANDRLRIVWNLPRLAELPRLERKLDEPLLLYYHGSITPERVPEAIIPTLAHFKGRARLRVVGYEAPGAPGFLAKLTSSSAFIDYDGTVEREDLLRCAALSHVGLALVPPGTTDPTMASLVGASNKPFDYMAAGQALLVSDAPAWRAMFVRPDYALACDPGSTGSLVAAISWLLEHPDERRAMGERGRAKIAADWNYDTAFATVLDDLNAMRLRRPT